MKSKNAALISMFLAMGDNIHAPYCSKRGKRLNSELEKKLNDMEWLEKEYNLVQEKKSNLSASERYTVVARWERTQGGK